MTRTEESCSILVPSICPKTTEPIHARCYQVIDPDGVERALTDIEAGKVAWSNAKEVRPLKLWLSPKTMGRLNTYVKKEMPGQWEGEALVVERALNTFLDNEATS